MFISEPSEHFNSASHVIRCVLFLSMLTLYFMTSPRMEKAVVVMAMSGFLPGSEALQPSL